MRCLLPLMLLWSSSALAAGSISQDYLLRGVATPVMVYGLTPGTTVGLVASTKASAPWFCPVAAAPTCTDLGRPAYVIGMQAADAYGTATFWVTAPAGPATVYLQAIAREAGAYTKSNPAPAVVVSPTADPDMDGLSNEDEILSWMTDPANPDTDGDTVPDGDEVWLHGTDPNNYDTDGGGVSDGEEIYWQATNPLDGYDDIDPWSRDSDGDGLYDGEETSIYGTDPWTYDTDGGGVGDGEEVWSGTNPLDFWDDYYGSYDSDGDGLLDDEEYWIGTDPYSYDSDGGGVGDGDEYWGGTNPLDPYDDYGPTYPTDSDGDGLSDDDEYWIGTDPWSYDSDGGGVGDGDEYGRGTDPLDPYDD